ncbi:cytoskeletal protein binding protein [Phlyctochytrium bullatum]|nr:cytoskeletal protein binding protein [Phlyctochytrium bullatum]
MKCKIVAKVLYDYEARTSEELSLQEGQTLLVVDDNDPDWWSCILRVSDTFEDVKEGLAPVNYIEEQEPKLVAVALYDYEARTEDEISFSEGATILVYENEDPEWWFARIDNNVGLVPANYVSSDADPVAAPTQSYEAPVNEGTSDDNDAAAQKAKLLNTLDMFGPGPKIPKAPKAEKVPGDLVDKKSKKNNRKIQFGVSDDYMVYFCDEFDEKAITDKWEFKELTKFSDKKGKKVILEFGSETRELEGEKEDVERIMKRLEEIKVRSTVSGPIITGPPPNVGPPPGSLSGNLPIPAAPPAPSPVVSVVQPVSAPPPAPPNPGISKPAVALYDYEATTADELTIQEDEELVVLDDTDEDWWLVRLVNRGGEGLVPKTYVELRQDGGGYAQSSNAASAAAAAAAAEEEERLRQEAEAREQQRREADRRAEERRRQEDERRQRVAAEEERQRKMREEEDRRRREREEEQRRLQKIEEEARRQEQMKPVLPSRPQETAKATASSSRPAMPQRASHEEPVIPSAVPRLPKPNESKLRTWTDRTGSFRVDAEFLHVADGKAHLHKTNGVKIAVPLEKLSQDDIDFVRRTTGDFNIGVSGAPKPKQGASAATLASAASAPLAIPAASSYQYNGFDWRDWLLKAGVSSGDALIYAQAFVNEKMDKSVLDDIDRDVLRRLGVSEGDIIRIRKYATTQIAYFGGSANAAAIAERERLAKAQNLSMLGKGGAVVSDAQILADEAFARELQKQELMGVQPPSSTSAVLRGNTRKPAPKNSAIDAQSVLAMKQALTGGGSASLTPQLSPPTTRSSSSSKAAPAVAPPPVTKTESVPEKPKPTINNDPWAASSLGANAVNSAVAAELQKQAATTAALQAQLLAQQQAQQQLAQQQSQLLAAQQQAALAAKKQAEIAAAQLQQQQAAVMQQQAAALNAKKQAELAVQQQQIEAAKVQAQKEAALHKMREETARLEAQLAEQKRLAASRPLQAPLIPTPSTNSAMSFVPVSNPRPALMAGPGAMGMMALAPQGFPQAGFQQTPQPAGFPTPLALPGPSAPVDPNDKYAAFKSLDMGSPSVFSGSSASQNQSAFGGGMSNSMMARPPGMGMGMGMLQPTPAMGNMSSPQMGVNGSMGMPGMQGVQGMQQQNAFGASGFGNPGLASNQGMAGGFTPQQLAYLQQQQQMQQMQQQGMMPGQYGR